MNSLQTEAFVRLFSQIDNDKQIEVLTKLLDTQVGQKITLIKRISIWPPSVQKLILHTPTLISDIMSVDDINWYKYIYTVEDNMEIVANGNYYDKMIKLSDDKYLLLTQYDICYNSPSAVPYDISLIMNGDNLYKYNHNHNMIRWWK